MKYVLLELVFYQEVSLRLPLELLDDFVVPSGGSQEGWGCGPWNSAWGSTLGGCSVGIHPGIIQQDSNHTVEKLTFNFTNMNIISWQPSDSYESLLLCLPGQLVVKAVGHRLGIPSLEGAEDLQGRHCCQLLFLVGQL